MIKYKQVRRRIKSHQIIRSECNSVLIIIQWKNGWTVVVSKCVFVTFLVFFPSLGFCFFFLMSKFYLSFHIIFRSKKRVVFADDKGKSLTEIRVMSEPSNVPPLWSIEFLSHVTHGFITSDVTEEWSVAFKQPASDYLNFR